MIPGIRDGKSLCVKCGFLHSTACAFAVACVLMGCVCCDAHARETNKLYWANIGNGFESIWRINFDGTQKECIITGTNTASPTQIGNVMSLAIDSGRGHVYVGETFSNNKLRRINLDGSGFTTLLGQTNLMKVYGLVLDLPRHRLFLAEHERHHICRANLDGSGLVELYGATNAYAVCLDVSNSRMYWVENPGGAGNGVVRRANIDGSGVEIFPLAVEDPSGLAFDLENGKIYWSEHGASFNTGRIKRCDMDGSNVELICGSTLLRPNYVTLDLEARRAYWCTGQADDVQYCDMLPGSSANDLVVDGNDTYCIALYLPPPSGTIFTFR